MPDGDVGSATSPSASSTADDDEVVTRPDLPPTDPPGAADPPEAAEASGVVPGEPILRAPAGAGGAPPGDGGVPAAAAPPRKARPARRRGRVIGGTQSSPPDQSTPATNEAAAESPSDRRSMSARLESIPDAPDDTPAAPPPVNPADPAAIGTDLPPPAEHDPSAPVLLVPEVLPPTAPTRRVTPARPDVRPPEPDVTVQPPRAPAADPEPAPYDLAAEEPALEFEPPPTRVRRRRPRVRRVTRVIRTVDTWSVFKVATVFAAVLYVSGLLSGVLLWNVAYATGTIDNAERFMESFGWQTFEFKGGEIFHDAWIIGLFAAAGLVGLIVLAAATFNLVSDLVGGVRVTVLEEEMVVRPANRRRKQRIRKAPPRAASASVPSEPTAEPGTALEPRMTNLPAESRPPG